MKGILSSHDITALLNELNILLGSGARLQNIYDIDTKTFCLKIQTEKKEKKFIFIESGKKILVSNDFKSIKKIPGGFCGKLRKTRLGL